MFEILKFIHTNLRYIILVLLLISYVSALVAMLKAQDFKPFHQKINKWTMMSVHIQLVVGLWLYIVSPSVQFVAGMMKDKELRYWAVEHLGMMLVAIALITIGQIKSKKAKESKKKHRHIVMFFGLGLLVIVVAILQSGRGLL